MIYSVRYVHKISPSNSDVGPDVVLLWSDFIDRKKLGKALREGKVIGPGSALTNFRAEGGRIEDGARVIAFPRSSVWHSIILTLKA